MLSTVMKCAPQDGCSLLLRVHASLTLHGERANTQEMGRYSQGSFNPTTSGGGQGRVGRGALLTARPRQEGRRGLTATV